MFISTAKSLFIFYQPADPEPAPGCLFRSLYSIKTRPYARPGRRGVTPPDISIMLYYDITKGKGRLKNGLCPKRKKLFLPAGAVFM